MNQGPGDLHTILRSEWEILLQDMQYSIISVTKTDKQEAYVLSENSMFVSKGRFILKICGSTILLKALAPLLKLAMDYSGYANRSFQEEVEFLTAVFPNGAEYCMGLVNSDCWYLYTLHFPASQVINQPAQTLEIMLSKLDPEFYVKNGVTAKDVTHESRICDLIAGSVIDCHNVQSFFETNLSPTSYDDFIKKVVEVFKPGKFVTTLFINQSSKCCTVLSPLQVEGFECFDCQRAVFNDYNFAFTSFVKKQQQ
ncbi:S-adenosylmethionine decarboxylase proenzyme [Galemys pyrenaicus]|uniref:S-adenosylmethionine decarboxylase proenzyme n=1 Tax=Galemys pyrenaicus TaxID=202257 RepID=A0A8J5ZLT4_GALPY|nr:S-adenosylmethionine decarboxylase proenzyme [Galemys pyrenaicus]